MKAGFVPALGTPLDKNGDLCTESFQKQIDDQISAGAVGLLCMGSMGQQAFIPRRNCPEGGQGGSRGSGGRVPVFVGAVDCSVAGAKSGGADGRPRS